MLVELTLYKANTVAGQASSPLEETGPGFSERLGQALISLCRELNVPLPLWLNKNTKEFAHFHQTLFFPEQFDEVVMFDRMRLKILE